MPTNLWVLRQASDQPFPVLFHFGRAGGNDDPDPFFCYGARLYMHKAPGIGLGLEREEKKREGSCSRVGVFFWNEERLFAALCRIAALIQRHHFSSARVASGLCVDVAARQKNVKIGHCDICIYFR